MTYHLSTFHVVLIVIILIVVVLIIVVLIIEVTRNILVLRSGLAIVFVVSRVV